MADGTIERDNHQNYHVRTCVPADLSKADMAGCIGIVIGGGAVDPVAVRRELPLASLLAVVRKDEEIVGVGAIKQVRRTYAATVARRSGHEFSRGTPELGYVARHRDHRGNKLAPRVVDALVFGREGSLWSTTDSDGMKAALAQAGFERVGNEWKGHRGQLSLWIRR